METNYTLSEHLINWKKIKYSPMLHNVINTHLDMCILCLVLLLFQNTVGFGN